MSDGLRHPYQFAVRYRRTNWKGWNVKFFQRESKAVEFRRKLLTGDPDLAPVDELIIERRQLGPVEVVFDLNELVVRDEPDA